MEYSTLKVPELRKILQERSLLATGNKADLVARLQEDDQNKAPAAAQPAAEDEIDYSDDEVTITTKAAESKPAAAPEAAPADPTPAAETAEAAEPAQDAPAAPETAEGEAPANGAEETVEETAEEPSKYALNLPATTTDEETRKREERAKRFGVVEDDGAAKKAERAKRFGLDQASLAKSLDSALPERSLKRRGQADESGGRKRQDRHGNANNNASNNSRGRGRQGRTGGGRTGGGRTGGGVSKTGGSFLDDPAEKAKAEARAKRFGAA